MSYVDDNEFSFSEIEDNDEEYYDFDNIAEDTDKDLYQNKFDPEYFEFKCLTEEQVMKIMIYTPIYESLLLLLFFLRLTKSSINQSRF